jgi:hypothetical protein
MAAGIMPAFEDEVNTHPSVHVYYCRKCNHKDCTVARKQRSAKCDICGEGFKAEERFYELPDSDGTIKYVHACCEEERTGGMR